MLVLHPVVSPSGAFTTYKHEYVGRQPGGGGGGGGVHGQPSD